MRILILSIQIVQVVRIHIDLRTVPVAQPGFFTIISMIVIPFIPVLIPIEVDVCGVKVVRIFFRFIIIGFFLL